MKANAILASLALVAALVGCGDDSKNETVNTAPAANEVAAAELVPEFFMVKVPVDANGNEIVEQYEAREFNGAHQFDSAENTGGAWDSGKAVEIANELDQDTSSQQWGYGRSSWYWNTPWYPGKLLGRGLWWGRNPYRANYRYNYYNNYYYNDCNYYVYRRYY